MGIVLFTVIMFISVFAWALFIKGDVFVFNSLILISWVVLVFALLLLVVRINLNPFSWVKFFQDGLVLIDRHGKEYQIYPFQIIYIRLTHSKSKKLYRFSLLIDRLSVEKNYFEGYVCFVIQDQPEGRLMVHELVNLMEQFYGCKVTMKVKL